MIERIHLWNRIRSTFLSCYQIPRLYDESSFPVINKMWPIKIVEGSQPGKRKKANDTDREIGSEWRKRANYEQEKRPERIFNNKWQEGSGIASLRRPKQNFGLQIVHRSRLFVLINI